MKHSPGPWKTDGQMPGQVWSESCDGMTVAIATTAHGDMGRIDRAAMKANARLIAAAPELLAVAEAVVDMGEGNVLPGIMNDARAAIAKATEGIMGCQS